MAVSFALTTVAPVNDSKRGAIGSTLVSVCVLLSSAALAFVRALTCLALCGCM